MELTIHIGPHKTGTTSIQAAFSTCARQLRREGVLYPKHHWRQQAHHGLAFALKGKTGASSQAPDLSFELDRLRRSLDRFQGKQALISSEEFFTCPPEALMRLRKAVPTKTRVVCFLRRPDDFLVSCYNQKIKQPGNGFAAPFAKFVDDPFKIAPEFDFVAAIENWAAVFGETAIHLETYESASPLVQLKALLGLSEYPKEPPTTLNASVPGAVAEIMRHAKLFGLSETKQRRLLTRAQKVYADFPPFYVSNDDRRAIISAVEPGLDRLFARYGKENPYTVDKYRPIKHSREYNMTLQDMMKLLSDLL